MNQDITSTKHGGNPESSAAFEAARSSHAAARKVIHTLLLDSPEGLTSSDIGRILGKEKNTFSGRITQLLAEGLAKRTDRRRDGCAVLIAA